MGISGNRAGTASAARTSIDPKRLRPKLVALMVASAAVLVAAGVIFAVWVSGNSAAQDGPDVSSAGASIIPQPETSRVKWTPAKAAGAAAGVAGLGTASWWAYNRYLKRKTEPERAVVDKPSKQAASHFLKRKPEPERAVVGKPSKQVVSHWANLKAHMTKANAEVAAKKGVSILGYDPVDAALVAMVGKFAHQESQPVPANSPIDPKQMSTALLNGAGFPYIPESRIMPADTEKLDRLRADYGPNAVFYVIQSIMLNPLGKIQCQSRANMGSTGCRELTASWPQN